MTTHTQPQTTLPRMLDIDELSTYLGIPERTLDGWRSRKSGPPYVKFGKAVRYPEHRLLRWLDEQLEGAGGVAVGLGDDHDACAVVMLDVVLARGASGGAAVSPGDAAEPRVRRTDRFVRVAHLRHVGDVGRGSPVCGSGVLPSVFRTGHRGERRQVEAERVQPPGAADWLSVERRPRLPLRLECARTLSRQVRHRMPSSRCSALRSRNSVMAVSMVWVTPCSCAVPAPEPCHSVGPDMPEATPP